MVQVKQRDLDLFRKISGCVYDINLRKIREKFFVENLDYVNRKKSLASDYVFRYFEEQWKV